jgi:hypothetical protein
MKKWMIIVVLVVASISVQAQSIDPVSMLIAKLIKALDLQVQKLQNQTLWLSQAQQVAEHQLSKLKLDEIADWQNRQKQLYAGYFHELKSVKPVVTNLPLVRHIISMQGEVVCEYKKVVQKTSTERSRLMNCYC